MSLISNVVDTLVQNVGESDAAFLVRVNLYVQTQQAYYEQAGGTYPCPVELQGTNDWKGYPPSQPIITVFWDSVNAQMRQIATFAYDNAYYVYLMGGPGVLPPTLNYPVIYQGQWDASTNTPTLTSGTGTQGHYYEVAVAGTTTLDGISTWGTTDWAVFNGTAWTRVVNSSTGGGGLLSGTATQVSPGVYTTTISGVTTYTAGDTYAIKFDSVNSNGSTLNINSLGAVNIFKNTSVPIASGDIKTNQELMLVYDGANFQAIGLVSSQILAYVHNAQGAVLTKGQAVYAYQATGDKMSVKLARADSDATSAKTIGLVYDSSIGIGGEGYIIIQGVIEGLNTAAYSAGDTLYLSASTFGGYTNVKPYAPDHFVYIGIVERANAGNGQIYVRCQNGYELDEIHNVDLVSVAPVTGDVLTYNSVSQLWSGKSISTILGYTPVPSSRTITINGVTYDLSVNRTWTISIGVTSVGLSLPSEFAISGSPVTGSGTLTGTWNNQNANQVLAGPSTGSPATPSFRSLVAADIPSITGQAITGYVSGAGTIAATDTILQAIQKLDGNSVFTIHTNFANFSPVDATTYYFGAQYSVTPSTVTTARILYIPYDCTLIGYSISISYTAGSAENSQIYCRINNTTDVQLGGNFPGNASIFTRGTTVATNLNANDYLNIKWACPTWATNIVAATGTVILYLKRR
jgi:hypothetical protein